MIEKSEPELLEDTPQPNRRGVVSRRSPKTDSKAVSLTESSNPEPLEHAVAQRPKRTSRRKPIRRSTTEKSDPEQEVSPVDTNQEYVSTPPLNASQPSAPEGKAKAFMHPSEQEFADLLDYYKINYLYEPRSFPLKWDGNRVVQMFTPDFYLPEYDQYFELTTMKQNLVTLKNRKLRTVRELYPEVNVQLLYRRDLMRLMGKYGFGPLADAPIEGTGKILFSEEVVQTRVEELAKEITKDYEGEEPVLIGVLRGVVVFMADLMRSIDLDLQIEFMEITHYGEETDGGIEVLRDSLTELKGKHVIIVEDIVDTGLTLRYLVEHLQAKEPASIKVCTLLDKPVRRMAGIPIGYVGFEIPDEFLVGYGLDYMGKFRNLPHLAILNRTEPKAVPQR